MLLTINNLAIFQPLKDIAVVNGSMARFECIVQCDPYPNITWSRNGMPIANDGGRYSIVFRNGVCRLTIPQAFTRESEFPMGVFDVFMQQFAILNQYDSY